MKIQPCLHVAHQVQSAGEVLLWSISILCYLIPLLLLKMLYFFHIHKFGHFLGSDFALKST